MKLRKNQQNRPQLDANTVAAMRTALTVKQYGLEIGRLQDVVDLVVRLGVRDDLRHEYSWIRSDQTHTWKLRPYKWLRS